MTTSQCGRETFAIEAISTYRVAMAKFARPSLLLRDVGHSRNVANPSRDIKFSLQSTVCGICTDCMHRIITNKCGRPSAALDSQHAML